MDFMTDALADGHRFCGLTLVDHFSRFSAAIEADFWSLVSRLWWSWRHWRAEAEAAQVNNALSSSAKPWMLGRTRTAFNWPSAALERQIIPTMGGLVSSV
jgi:hypothetical protein